LEVVGTESQKAADVNYRNKDSTQFTSTAIGTITPFAALDGPSVMCPRRKDIDDIDSIKELRTPSPISSLDESFYDMSDFTENISSFELDYSFVLEGVGTEIPKTADVNDCNKGCTQFMSDTTRT
jgi:hypothetical protein